MALLTGTNTKVLNTGITSEGGVVKLTIGTMILALLAEFFPIGIRNLAASRSEKKQETFSPTA